MTGKRRAEEVEQLQSGDFRHLPQASVAEAEPAREQEGLFRLTLRNVAYGDLLGAPGGGDFSLLEWDAKSTTIRQVREAVASAVLATWKAEQDAGAERPSRLHWESIYLLMSAPVTRRPSASPPPPSQPHRHRRDSVGSVSSDSSLVDLDTDVLLEDGGGTALLCDALRAHGAGEVQSEDVAQMAANAFAACSPLFELKYYVRTFEAFADREDLEQALALLRLFWDAAATFRGTRGPVEDTPLDGAVAAQFQAIQCEKRGIEDRYGPVRIWDLSLLPDLSYLLTQCRLIADKMSRERGYRELRAHMAQGEGALSVSTLFDTTDMISAGWDISGWDISGAISVSGMFRGCKNFNSDISAWNVRKVEDFSEMFRGCAEFNQNLASWNVGNGTDFSRMFENCRSFNQNLDSWDVAKAEKLDRMFINCLAFDQSLASWQVQGVKAFDAMFQGCASFAQDLSSWDVDWTASVKSMFARCEAFHCDLSSWEISDQKRADMYRLFEDLFPDLTPHP